MDFDPIIDEFYTPIYRFCLFFLGSEAEAADATQDTFVKAHRSINSIRKNESTKHWIYAIARNTCIDRKRWWKRLRLFQEQSVASERVEQSEDLKILLKRLIAELPERQREVFILRHWHGFSTEETAQLLRVEEGTVKSHLKRAIDKLKSDFNKI